jgi:hypothetical protein
MNGLMGRDSTEYAENDKIGHRSSRRAITWQRVSGRSFIESPHLVRSEETGNRLHSIWINREFDSCVEVCSDIQILGSSCFRLHPFDQLKFRQMLKFLDHHVSGNPSFFSIHEDIHRSKLDYALHNLDPRPTIPNPRHFSLDSKLHLFGQSTPNRLQNLPFHHQSLSLLGLFQFSHLNPYPLISLAFPFLR